MAGNHMRDKNLSQTYLAKRVQEILDLSEARLLEVLQGKTKIPERMVVQVALEIYKRRVPMKAESEHQGSHITMVKIVKNHLPNQNQGEVVDLPIDDFDKVEKMADQIVDERLKKINEKIKRNANLLGRPPTAELEEQDE